MASNLSPKKVKELKEAFALFDKDGNGQITTEELGDVMRSLGFNPTPAELKDMIHDADRGGDGTIQFNEFVTLMTMETDQSDLDMELKGAFDFFDKDKSGFITADELKQAMRTLGEDMRDEDIDEMMRSVDITGDGKVSYEQFVKMMNA